MRSLVSVGVLTALLFFAPFSHVEAAGELNWGILDPNAPAKAGNSVFQGYNEGQEQILRQQRQQLQIEQIRLENERQKILLQKLREEKNNQNAIQANVDNTSKETQAISASLSFIKESNGINLLQLIEEFKKGSDDYIFLVGFIAGINHALSNVNFGASILLIKANPALEKLRDKKKLTKDEEKTIQSARTATFIAPTGLLRMPANVSIAQQIAIIEKYLNEHPEKLHLSAYLLMTEALIQAFSEK